MSQAMQAERLRQLLEEGRPVTVLGIRPAADRAEWYIPGSIHVDAYDALKAGDAGPLEALELPRDRPVVVVCHAGNTSRVAAERLASRGYEAYSLAGGMRAWSLAWNVAEVRVEGAEARVIQVRRTGKGCLSYLIGSGGEAAVIDASLEPQVYLGLARELGWRIVRVLETHVHADHLMRGRRLAELAGATLHLPRQGRVRYPYEPLEEGDRLSLGWSTLEVLHTPGHTAESVTYRLDGRALFTGDTLFLDGIGRPDLEAADEASLRDHARQLHRSLRRLLALPADTLVLPGHTGTPVPFDGRPLVATLGELRPRLAIVELDEDTFVAELAGRIPPTPPNYRAIVAINESGEGYAGDPTALEAGANRCAIA